MSRISSNASMLASDDRSPSKKEPSAGLDLEGLLASVVEEQEYLPSKKRNRRKSRPRRQTLTSSDPILRSSLSSNEVFSVPSPIHEPDRVKESDATLILTIQQQKNARNPRKIPISFGPHQQSEHVLRLQGMVQPVEAIVREPVERTIHAWVAPYEPPPSLERLVAEASDLYIDYVDPQCYFEQFTPADPRVALQEAQSIWARVRAPFIRWEVQRLSTAPSSLRSVQRASRVVSSPRRDEKIVKIAVFDQDQIVAPASPLFVEEEQDRLFQEQMTTPVPVTPSSFSFFQRLRLAWQGFGDGVEERLESAKEREEEMVTEVEQEWGVPILIPRLDTVKVLAGFMSLLLVASLPAGAVSLSRSFRVSVNQTVQESQAAIDVTRQAFQGGQPSSEALTQATQRFQSAEASLRHANALVLGLANAIPQARQTYQGGQALLQAGEKSTRAAQILSDGLNRAWTIPVHYPDERLQALELYLDEATPLIKEARDQVNGVEAQALPESIRPHIAEVQLALSQGEASLQDLRTLVDLGLLILGHNEPRTYLFVFQNPSELRPSGGFMGSMTQVVFDRGAMKQMYTPGGGPYDLRNQLTARVLGPQPLQLLKDQWEFQDANWFADFPQTAQKINWFWSKSGQPTLDGVIAVNASLLEKILTITGPIAIPEFGKTVSAENVLEELQKSVELDYDKTENQPKKIIGVLMPKVLEKMRTGSQQDALRFLNVFATALETKDVQMWMTRPEEQSSLESFRWAGKVASAPGDTLAVIEANIGGQKTDSVIHEKVKHEVEIQEDGSMVDTVTLQREHTGNRGELFHGANNVEFVRFYAPQGSELLSASGFTPPTSTLFKQPLPTDEQDADLSAWVTNAHQVNGLTVTNELGRTAFGGWIQLQPGHTAITSIRYKLPMTVQDIAQRVSSGSEEAPSAKAAAYLLSLTSQSGKTDRQLEVHVRIPSRWQIKWASDDWKQNGSEMILPASDWNRDRAFGLLFDLSHAQNSQENP